MRRRLSISTVAVAAATMAGLTLVALPGAPAIAQPATSNCGAPADTVPPTVIGVTVSKSTVDVAHGRSTEQVDVHVKDTSARGAASGVAMIHVEFQADRGQLGPGTFRLHSGTTTNGIWRATLHVPSTIGASPGARHPGPQRFSLEWVKVRDVAGNFQVDSPFSYAGPTTKAYDASFVVMGATAPPPPPRVLPKLVALQISPHNPNENTRRQAVTVRARWSRIQPAAATLGDNLQLKEQQNGWWTGRFTPYRWAGTAAKLDIYLSWRPRGRTYGVGFNESQLRRHGFNPDVTDHGRRDKTEPVVESLTLSSTSVDTTSSPAKIDVSAEATDDDSGVKSVTFRLDPPQDGYPLGLTPTVRLTRVGSSNHYAGSYIVPTCIPTGDYTTDVSVEDHADNYDSGPDPESSVDVTSHYDPQPVPLITSVSASKASGVFDIGFNTGVENLDPDTINVFGPDGLEQINSITCFDADADATACDGSAGLVTTATFTLTSFDPGGEYSIYANEYESIPQLSDGLGNPVPWHCFAYDDSTVDYCDSLSFTVTPS